jgi:HAE1 family hydrophobic/amphiphilic exporter-1
VVLVTLVVFIFLQNLRATFIPLLTVPVALIGTFIFFPLLGFSVNTLSASCWPSASWWMTRSSWWKR